MERYREIEFDCGCSIAEAVNILLKYHEKGEKVCGEFNGKLLYSDIVTLDGAYLDIMGKTRAEFLESQERWRENMGREDKDFKSIIPFLTVAWVSRGKNILTEDYWDYWSEIVPIRLGDIYRGYELGACLDIVEILNRGGTLDEAKQKIEDQNHSGMSYGLVRTMVREFCSRGEEFSEYTI